MCRLFAIAVASVIGSIGLLFTMATFALSKMVLLALWNGVFERPDFMGDTGNVAIFRAADPVWFRSNVEFYGLAAFLCGLMAMLIVVPLAIFIKWWLAASTRRRLSERAQL